MRRRGGVNPPGFEAARAPVVGWGMIPRRGLAILAAFLLPVLLALPARGKVVLLGIDGASWNVIDPLVAALAGRGPRPKRCGQLTAKVSSRVGLAEIALLTETGDGLRPLEGGALSLTALAGADAILHLSPESEGFAAGERVEADVL